MTRNLVRISEGKIKQYCMNNFDEIKDFVINNPGKSARICIHSDNSDLLHQMIIAHRRGNYIRPHKHEAKSESFHLIEGTFNIYIFNDEGKVNEKILMSINDNIIFRIEKNIWHTVVPISDVVIFHEITNGPFVGTGDSVFPEWAPDSKNEEVKDIFLAELIKYE